MEIVSSHRYETKERGREKNEWTLTISIVFEIPFEFLVSSFGAFYKQEMRYA